MLIISIAMLSCRSNYTRIGAKDANYIPYYLKVYEADSLYIVGNYKRSYEILDSLFNKYEPINMEVYNEYETYLISYYMSDKRKKIDEILKKSFLEFGSRYDFFKKDSLLNKILEISSYREKEILHFEKEYSKKLNLILRDTIEVMILKDRECRLQESINMEVLAKINKENSEKIKYIFNNYGYPSVKKIGRYSFNQKVVDLGAVYLHCNVDFLENYLFERLKKFGKNGQTSPMQYASVYDKFLISYDGGKQLYGTFYKNQKELMPLINEKKLDSIRKSIGLENVNYSKWRLKAKYNYEF